MQAAHGELEGRIQDLTAQLEEAQAAAVSSGQHTKALAFHLIWRPCISALHAGFSYPVEDGPEDRLLASYV